MQKTFLITFFNFFKSMKNRKKLLAAAVFILAAFSASYAVEFDPPLLERDTVYMSSLGEEVISDYSSLGYTDTSVNLYDGVVLTPDNLYILDRKAYVIGGRELTIMPGVVIKAVGSSSGLNSRALIVCRDAKIYAAGTPEHPIIFTTVEDPLDGTYPITEKEKWGGVMILGRAQNNILDGDQNPENPGVALGYGDGVGYIEGLPWPDARHHYGDSTSFKNNDNSGILSYISIRHGGSEIGTANEINGLTLGSVGNGTQIDHIEVIANGDDGIEFFGGTVNVKYASIMFCEDDYIDWDQGYCGKIQFVLGVQLPTTSGGDVYNGVSAGDNGLECDGYDYLGRTPLSDPTISNVTIIGNDVGTSGDVGMELKEGTLGEINNSIIAKFAHPVRFTAATHSGALDLNKNTFVHCGTGVIIGTNGDSTGFAAAGNILVSSLAGFDDSLTIGILNAVAPYENEVFNTYDAVPASYATQIGDVFTLPTDGFFTAVNYRGAFAPNSEPWTTDWTYHSVIGTDKTGVECPTDLNNDATTNGEDLLIVLGKFGPCSPVK